MFTSLKIALRFLTKSKIQTIVIILGIAIGVSVQIFIGLLSKGLEGSLLSKVVGNTTHISIYAKNGIISNYDDIEKKVKSTNAISVISPEVEKQAVINLENKKQPVAVKGFIPDRMNVLYDMKSKIYKGRMVASDNEVIIGKDLNESLGLNLGDKINLVTTDGSNLQVVVTGFYDIGAVKVNKSWVVTNLKTAQNLASMNSNVNSIEIGLKDPYSAQVVAKQIGQSLNDSNLKLENWMSQNKMLISAISGQKICTVVIEFFVLLAAVLSIVSILGISVVQKYKQIGILKAMGIKDGSASLIFLLQAFILGVLGTAAGIALTFLYIKGFNRYIITPEGNPVVDIIINKRFIKLSSIIDIGASTLAAIFPALKSFKLSPVEVIKNG